MFSDDFCQNVLLITCKNTIAGRNSLLHFIQENTTTYGSLSFNKKFPLPDCECHREFYWGCKLDIGPDTQLVTKQTKTEFLIHFDTQNGSCEEWLRRIYNIYRSLHFKLVYSHYSGDYSGILQASYGLRTRYEVGDYLTFSPMHYVFCPECESELNFDFEKDSRQECRSIISHIQKYEHCKECSCMIFQRNWSKARIIKFINDNINHRLYRYPDGLRLPSITAHFYTYT